MPCLSIFTNVPKTKIPADFTARIIPILSRTVGKSEDKFICMINGDCTLTFRGESTIPSAVGTLESIGHIEPARNITVSKEISDYLFATIGVKPEHFFLSFYDQKATNIGIAGTTVSEIEK